MPGAYIVPKGNPAGREAMMKFIATAQEVPAQLAMLDCLGMTPSNPAAFAQIPEDQQPYAITSAMNIDKIVYQRSRLVGQERRRCGQRLPRSDQLIR